MDEGRLGAGEDQLVLYVSMLFKHVLPSLYPQMVDPARDGMGKGRYHALKDAVSSAAHALFSEGAALALGKAVEV